MGILQGKNILVTGVLTDGSIAFHIAKIAQEEGANVLLTGFGRALSLTTRIAGRLPQTPPIIELDVTDQGHLDGRHRCGLRQRQVGPDRVVMAG